MLREGEWKEHCSPEGQQPLRQEQLGEVPQSMGELAPEGVEAERMVGSQARFPEP